MSVQSFNVAVREQVQHTLTRQLPVVCGAELYRATGKTEERQWSGPWEQMVQMFEGLEYSFFKRLSATLVRVADGEFGELTATWTYYEAGDGADGAGDGVQPGADRDHPEYDLQVQTVQEPILTHPKWAGLSDDKLTALKMLMDGYKKTEKFVRDDGSSVRIYDELHGSGLGARIKLILQGVSAYNSPHIVLTVRYKGTVVPSIATVGSIVADVPGGFKTPAGRNWYFHGPSWSMRGAELWITEVYELSGPGGWSDFIYGS